MNHWFQKSIEDIIRIDMGIPLNDEMIKQIRPHEGDTNILYRLSYMVEPKYLNHETREAIDFSLTDKQINFLARMMLQNIDISVIALKKACMSGLMAGIPTKDIEFKIKQVREKYKTINY